MHLLLVMLSKRAALQWPLPLLFILFINSLTKVYSSDVICILFADDVKLYSVVSNLLTYSLP